MEIGETFLMLIKSPTKNSTANSILNGSGDVSNLRWSLRFFPLRSEMIKTKRVK